MESRTRPSPGTPLHFYCRFEVLVDNPRYVHHMILYACTSPPPNPRDLYQCGSMDIECRCVSKGGHRAYLLWGSFLHYQHISCFTPAYACLLLPRVFHPLVKSGERCFFMGVLVPTQCVLPPVGARQQQVSCPGRGRLCPGWRQRHQLGVAPGGLVHSKCMWLSVMGCHTYRPSAAALGRYMWQHMYLAHRL